jgi:hypothetical protein
MTPIYKQILGFEAHEQHFKQGVAIATTRLGMNAEQVKQADNAVNTITGLGDLSARTLMTASLVTGVPIGILAHVIGKKVTERTAKETELKDQIGYYRNAATDIESEMARQGIRR